jgi:hypothetical protein
MSAAKLMREPGGVVRWAAPMRWDGDDYLLSWTFEGDACRIFVDEATTPHAQAPRVAALIGFLLTFIQLRGGYSFARLCEKPPGAFAAHICAEIQKHMRSAG